MRAIRILIILSGFICAALYSCNGTEQTQNKADSAQNDSTTSLVVPDSVHYEIPKELKYDSTDYQQENDPFKLIAVGHFYPIGFSKDGLFAYAQMMADTSPGSKNQRYEIQIRDVINDSIVWLITEKIPGSAFVDKDMIRAYTSPIDNVWTAHYPEIASALWHHKIIQHNVTEQKNLSFYLKDDLIVHGENANKMVNHDDGYLYWSDAKLWMVSHNSNKQKLIYSHHFGENGPRWFIATGYLQDPYSNRMVTLVELYFRKGKNGIEHQMYDIVAADPSTLQ